MELNRSYLADLSDMQSLADDGFKFIMIYQDQVCLTQDNYIIAIVKNGTW